MSSSKVRTVLTIGGIVVGVGIFAGVIYWKYVREYAKSHPEPLSDEELVEIGREKTEVDRVKVLPQSTEKPLIASLVRDEKDRIDYSSLSSGYQGERIRTDTKHIVKDARGSDKGRDSLEEVIERVVRTTGDPVDDLADGETAEEVDILEERIDDGSDLPEGMLVDDSGIVQMVPQSIRNAPFGKSQAELALRFKVIDKLEYEGAHEFFDNKVVSYFPEDQVIAGFGDSLVEVDDIDLLAQASTMVDVHGLEEGYVRDMDAGVDYKIIRREGSYDAAYERWVLSNENDE